MMGFGRFAGLLPGLMMMVFSAVGATQIAAAEEEGMTLTVRGEVFRECTVSMPDEGTFHLGNFTTADWVENRNWLGQGDAPVFTFLLTGCDPGTLVTISASGTAVDAGDRISWLANQRGTATELAASIALIKSDGTTVPLALNETGYPCATISSAGAPAEVKLRGTLRRTDNRQRPAGTFLATLTIRFEFA